MKKISKIWGSYFLALIFVLTSVAVAETEGYETEILIDIYSGRRSERG